MLAVQYVEEAFQVDHRHDIVLDWRNIQHLKSELKGRLVSTTESGLASFLAELFDSGSPKVAPPSEVARSPYGDISQNHAAAEVLRQFEKEWRREFPGDAPPYREQVALWGAEVFFRACQCFLHRELDETYVRETLGIPCPKEDVVTSAYSADLTFRFLPDLIRFARAASSDDPLTQMLLALAIDWPFSSVGVEPPENAPPRTELIESICVHRGMRTLYVDRILTREAHDRINVPVVQTAVLEAIGDYGGALCPDFLKRNPNVASGDSPRLESTA